MKEKTRLKSLEEIALNYTYVLIDNCAFQGLCNFKIPNLVMNELERYLKKNKYPQSSERDIKHLGKIAHYLTQKKSIMFWKEKIKHYRNCYTIPEVLQEIKNPNPYDYKEKTKRKNERKVRYLQKLRRTINDSNIEREKLIEYLENENRILEFDREEKNSYDESYEKHIGFEDDYGLHGADFPLLIHGLIIAKTRGSSVIISNDSKLGDAWKYLLRTENLSRRRFGFLTRQDIHLFEKWR